MILFYLRYAYGFLFSSQFRKELEICKNIERESVQSFFCYCITMGEIKFHHTKESYNSGESFCTTYLSSKGLIQCVRIQEMSESKSLQEESFLFFGKKFFEFNELKFGEKIIHHIMDNSKMMNNYEVLKAKNQGLIKI